MRLDIATVVQTDDAAGGSFTDDQTGDALGGPFPITADDGPQDAEEAELLLHLTHTEPAQAIGGAQEGGCDAEFGLDYLLGEGEFAGNGGWRENIGTAAKAGTEARMRIRVIANFVPSMENGASNIGMTADIQTTLKERRRHVPTRQGFDELPALGGRAVIKR